MSAPTPTTSTKLSPTAEVFTPALQAVFKLPAELVNAAGEAQWRRLVLPYKDLLNAGVDHIAPGVGVRSLLPGSLPDHGAFLTNQKAVYSHGDIGGPALNPTTCPALTPERRGRHEFEVRTKLGAMGSGAMTRDVYRPNDVISNVKLLEGSFTTDEHIFRSFIVGGVPHDYPTAAIAAAFSVCLPLHPISATTDHSAIGVSIIEVYQCCPGLS